MTAITISIGSNIGLNKPKNRGKTIEGFGSANLLDLYRRGLFPMADGRDDPRLLIIEPEKRGILPLDNFHIPSRLRRQVKQNPFQIAANRAFRHVIEECAAQSEERCETWINRPIIQLYDALHRDGYAHSIEVWDDDLLVGGLYGVAIGGAFFGESMFSRKSNASKIALVHLVAGLISAGFQLLDAQFVNQHLVQFGIIEISKSEFQAKLKIAIKANCQFPAAQYAQIQSSNSAFPLSQGAHCLALIAQARALR